MKAKGAITLFLCMVFIFLSTYIVQNSITTNATYTQNSKSKDKEVFIASNTENEANNMDEEGNNGETIHYKNYDGIMLTITNIQSTGEPYFFLKGDIYENDTLLVKNFPFGCPDDGCTYPKYNRKKGIISSEAGRGDIGFSYKTKAEYHLKTKKFYSYVKYFVEKETISQRGFLFGEGEKNEVFLDGSSTLSIAKLKYKTKLEKPDEFYARKNYIYNKNLKFSIKDNLLYAGNVITIMLGNKKFKVDFNKLETSKENMPLLNSIRYFHYEILFSKKGNTYTLSFKDIKNSFHEKTVESIGIVSCKSNYSPTYDKQEYKLKKDKNGNFKYNISEKFNNKCNIPYKINVYYTDGSKETGEYYILFDY